MVRACRSGGSSHSQGSVRWRTVLGSPWRSPLSVAAGADAIVSLAEDGEPLSLPIDRLDQGGFVEVTLPRRAQPGFRKDRSRGWSCNLRASPCSSRPAGPTTYRSASAASRIAASSSPRHWPPHRRCGETISSCRELTAVSIFWTLAPAPSAPSRMFRPMTARIPPAGGPRPRSTETPWSWSTRTGTVLRIQRTPGTGGLDGLSVAVEASLGAAPAADPLSTGGAVIVATRAGQIRAVATHNLSPIGTWPLAAPTAFAPTQVSGRGFLADVAGNVHAFCVPTASGSGGSNPWRRGLRPAGRDR